MLKRINNFFDKLEDQIRIALSHHPILYSFIGAVGIILLWKGVWETAELFPILFGPVSVIVGTIILLVTGLLVSFFIGDRIILSGLTREKKLVEKTESEVRSEQQTERHIEAELKTIEGDLKKLEEKIDGQE
jgi:hypothetical protein